MGLLNDVKAEVKAEAKEAKVAAETADKAGRKARAKERKEAKAAALAHILEYLAKNPVKELEKDVEMLSKKAARPAGFGTSLLTTIFGSETPAKGTKISALDVFTKYHKGYPEMRKLMKKAEEKGVHIKLDAASQTYIVE